MNVVQISDVPTSWKRRCDAHPAQDSSKTGFYQFGVRPHDARAYCCKSATLTFLRIDGVGRQGSDTQLWLWTARSGVNGARPSQAKCELALHYNRRCMGTACPAVTFRLCFLIRRVPLI